MGKQICFFATPNDYFAIFDYVIEKEWFFINDYGVKIPYDTVKRMVQSHYNDKGFVLRFYLTKKGLNIVNNAGSNSRFVDALFSDVIEISICSPPPPNVRGLIVLPNQYEHGRFWYEKQYYDQNDNIITKSQELDKMYSSLVRRVRKNAIISKTKFAYILPDAYRKYKEGTFIPCSGRNTIEFD